MYTMTYEERSFTMLYKPVFGKQAKPVRTVFRRRFSSGFSNPSSVSRSLAMATATTNPPNAARASHHKSPYSKFQTSPEADEP
jgi:hypothetical protein